MRLRELAPDHGIFNKTAFLDDARDEMSLGSQRSVKLHEFYKEMLRNSLRLRTCINEIEQLVSLIRSPVGGPPAKQWKRRPLRTRRARKPDGAVQWGGAGIVINSESSVTGAGRGRDSGTTTLRPINGTDGIGLTSTGGGFPGARVICVRYTLILTKQFIVSFLFTWALCSTVQYL